MHRDERTHTVGEEPMLVDDILAEEERYAGEGAVEEVGCSGSGPLEDREAGIGTQHKQGNDLLHEEADQDSAPDPPSDTCTHDKRILRIPLNCRAVVRERPEEELEDGKAKHRDSAVAVGRVLLAGFSLCLREAIGIALPPGA